FYEDKSGLPRKAAMNLFFACLSPLLPTYSPRLKQLVNNLFNCHSPPYFSSRVQTLIAIAAL
ncbi:hypothetical protein AB6C40_15895, partial [Vibrio splendidus]